MFASIKTQRFPSSLLLLVLLTLNNASAHRNKPFLRKAQSTPTNEMQCLQDTVDFVSASRDLTAHSLLYYSNLMDGLSTEQQPQTVESEADTEPIDDTTPVILVDISSSEFRQTCTEEGGIVLVEPELNVSCQNQGGVTRSFKIVNAANCLSSQDSCNGIDLVTSYRPLLEDENMVCQRIISQGVVQQGGAEEEDEVDEEEMIGTETDPNAQAEVQDNDIDTDTDMDNDMDNQEEDNENENEEGNVSVEEEVDVDDEMDEEEDGELSDDSTDSDEDDEDMSVSASASSSALKTGVGRVGGPVVGVLLLVLVGIGAAWFMMKRRRNDK